MHKPSIDRVVERAKAGDAGALDALLRSVRDDVYGLAVRMLWHPEDAEDATQEILLRAVTHLSTFRGDSAFATWIYRIASNYLLTTRKRRAEREEVSFDAFGAQLADGLRDGADYPEASAERRLLIEEVKIGCSQAMLLCLDREHRLAYILGEIVELDGPTAAAVLEISPAAFRKRLSRARRRVETFMKGHCGLVDRANPCRCHRRVESAIGHGRFAPGRLLFADRPRGRVGDDPILSGKRAVEHLTRRAAEIQRSNPDYTCPTDLVQRLQALLASDEYQTLWN